MSVAEHYAANFKDAEDSRRTEHRAARVARGPAPHGYSADDVAPGALNARIDEADLIELLASYAA